MCVQPYGALLVPVKGGVTGAPVTLIGKLGDDIYTASLSLASSAGVYTITIGGTVASGDKITIDGTEVTLDSTSGASANAAATAVRTALGSNANYTVSGSGANVILTEKSGKYGVGMPDYKITSTAGTLTAVVTTDPSPVGVGTSVTFTKSA